MHLTKILFKHEMNTIMNVLGTDNLLCFKPFEVETFIDGNFHDIQITNVKRNKENEDLTIRFNMKDLNQEYTIEREESYNRFPMDVLDDTKSGIVLLMGLEERQKVEDYYTQL